MISGSVSLIRNENERSLVRATTLSQCPIVEDPQIVLISYAKRYMDIARLIRLKFIAQVCPKLRVEALELAINHVKKTYNVKMYEELYRTLCTERERTMNVVEANDEAASSSGAASVQTRKVRRESVEAHQYDAYWVEDNTMESTLLLQELDAELNFKKSNSGSAYVRRILEEIGDYHVKSGNLQLAVKFYARARPYCTSSDNVINMFRNLIRVSIFMSNWWHVLSYIDEAKQYALGFPILARAVPAQLSCAAGLANMGLKIYKTAAHCFLLTPYDQYNYDKIVAPQDVAFYAGLCGLATLETDMLKLGCLNSEKFKPFFSLSPIMWEILTKFFNNEFDLCERMLRELESRVRLDIYLAPHVDALYNKIQIRIQDRRHACAASSSKSSTTTLVETRDTTIYFKDDL
ncbi:COP9 signalosome complex subunit 1 [Drosophila hydei]|uniref:COP9 signalosome complex subunit 1 n=1 Tax=Drosophila hydei TaxID=7224 RepID=A0A6J1LR66_DROHY|nr:COP9 signalosome complex subunit 1 [Drosophila hydei]